MRRGSSSESSKIFLRVLKGMSPTLPHFRSWVKAWTTAALPPCCACNVRLASLRASDSFAFFLGFGHRRRRRRRRRATTVKSFRCSPLSLSPQSGRATLHPSLARVRRRRERSRLVTNLEWKKRLFIARAFSPPKFAQSRGRRPRRA